MLFAGLIYAWSVLSLPIAANFPQYTKAEMSFTFTLGMIFFCIGGLISGIVLMGFVVAGVISTLLIRRPKAEM